MLKGKQKASLSRFIRSSSKRSQEKFAWMNLCTEGLMSLLKQCCSFSLLPSLQRSPFHPERINIKKKLIDDAGPSGRSQCQNMSGTCQDISGHARACQDVFGWGPPPRFSKETTKNNLGRCNPCNAWTGASMPEQSVPREIGFAFALLMPVMMKRPGGGGQSKHRGRDEKCALTCAKEPTTR